MGIGPEKERPNISKKTNARQEQEGREKKKKKKQQYSTRQDVTMMLVPRVGGGRLTQYSLRPARER